MTIEAISQSIQAQTKAHSPVLIAIDGFGGSGKTTLALKLQQLLGSAYIINMDDFIVKEKVLETSWDKGGFDRARLEKQVLKPASHQQPIRYQQLIWEKNTLSNYVEVPEVDYLIVEGISSLHPEITHYYDFKIWVETPIDVAKQRGHARDSANENAKHWDLWAQNDVRYQQKYHPEKSADFVIDNA